MKTTLVIATLLVIAGAAGRYLSGEDTSDSISSHVLATVERGELALSVSASGTLNPLVTVHVGSQVSGTIEKVYADFNSQIKKGDAVAQIEASLFEAQVAEAQANLESAEAAREKASVTVKDAERQRKRANSLHARNMLAESEVDAAQLAYDLAVVEHKVAGAEVAQSKAALHHEKVNLAHTTIYAPIDGVVLSRNVAVGQTVAASLQAPTLFIIAQDLSSMQIETDVDEAFIGMIREGQIVNFTVFAYPKEVFEGKLVQIRLNPQVESEVVLYNSIIRVDNADLKLKPGMTATVTIEVDRRQDVLKVPNAALRYLPDLPPSRVKELRESLDPKKHEAFIWTLTEQGVKPIKVGVGLTADRETEIRAPGLVEGTRVIVSEERGGPDKKNRRGINLF